MSNLYTGPDGKPRCGWCAATPEYVHYHDNEWGFPVDDDRRLFEKLCLEGFQSGLSWRTILNEREAFRAAFDQFDIEKVARFGPQDVERLLGDPGIVRHRGKIEAVINNAKRALELIAAEGSLAAYVWRFEAPLTTPPQSASTSPASRSGATPVFAAGHTTSTPFNAKNFEPAKSWKRRTTPAMTISGVSADVVR